MYLDFAPLEGITTALYRRLHQKYFPGVDRYYTPFLSPTQDHRLTPREQRELLPEYNNGVNVIPQILTKQSEDFLWAANTLFDLGYKEINLNLGCPSGTVTAKGKGSGMLADPSKLDLFLEVIYSKAPCKISIKTRLGMEKTEEFERILRIYNQYPLSELIIHPRVRTDFYRHPVRTEAFEAARNGCRTPLSYNGSIITPEDFRMCESKYPDLKAIMIGQGIISDPFLASRIRYGTATDRTTLQKFLNDLLEGYTDQFGSRVNAAKRMKDIWFYLIRLFENSEKHGKKILKSKTPDEYETAVAAVLQELPLLERSSGGW